jgi:serine/threonine protein phosphatase PrpC
MANEVHFRIGAASDVGRERQLNEDAHGFVRCSAGDLLVLCDGMGGHAAGDVASRTACDAILAFAVGNPQLPPTELLSEAIRLAHEAIHRSAARAEERAGMGSTCVVALVRGERAWVANVGDSRCYLVRSGVASLISVDHTKARKLLDAGIISAVQYATHPEKGVLSQALGQKAPPQPFVSDAMDLGDGEYLVLCSDGAYESTVAQLAALTSGANPSYAAHDMVRSAVERDGRDNATVVVGRYGAMEGGAPRPPAGSGVATVDAGQRSWAARVASVVATARVKVLSAGALALVAAGAGFGLARLTCRADSVAPCPPVKVERSSGDHVRPPPPSTPAEAPAPAPVPVPGRGADAAASPPPAVKAPSPESPTKPPRGRGDKKKAKAPASKLQTTTATKAQ